jgi:hypothetical protein
MQGRLASRTVIYNDRRKDRDHPVQADPCDQQGFMVYLLRQLKLYGADTSKLKIAIGKRRSMAFKGMEMLGFSVSITGCDEPLTNLILANGLGDFQANGCGVFRGYSRS